MAVRNLREGTVLKSKYRIGQVLGFGGFGITYLARNLELSQTVVIKEYFPMDLGRFIRKERKISFLRHGECPPCQKCRR